MTLLITVFAALAASAIWYCSESARRLRVGFLSLMFWGAALMWSVDAVFEYAELHEKFFTPSAADMLNDSYLGVSVVALGLVIWLVTVLVQDPNGVVKAALFGKKVNQ